MNATFPLVFDGHNDVLSRLATQAGTAGAAAFLSGLTGHIDQPRARAGGFGGGFFAVWVASPDDDLSLDDMCQPRYDLPLPEPLARDVAEPVVAHQIALLEQLEQLGAVRICRHADDIRNCLGSDRLAAVLHLEGAEVIDPELQVLDQLYARGLRSLGPVWSRPTRWAEGVPFRFPGSPDTGGGLSDEGVALVKRCNALGVMVDVSHMNEAGFHDVASHSVHPVVATHSNVHALCPHARNLTDVQLGIIADCDGMVGLNFATAFLRADGQMRRDAAIDTMLRHLDHLLAVVGEQGVGFGSDFDGAVVPDDLGDCSGLVALRQAMRAHGYDDELMGRLCHQNWLRVLELTW